MSSLSMSSMKERLEAQGYSKLGNGLYSTVYAHPKHKDVAVKVGSQDDWPAYVSWATKMGYAGTFAPKVYSLKHFGDFYVATMERLVTDINGIKEDNSKAGGTNSAYGTIYPNLVYAIAEGDPEYPELDQFAKDLKNTNFQGDYHDGNFMVRKDGSIVLTDPSSRLSESSPRIKRGKVIN